MMIEKLRELHPRFEYRSFSVAATTDAMTFSWEFVIEPNLFFRPFLKIKLDAERCPQSLSPDRLNQLAFQLGLVEMLSYWKAACCPVIAVTAGVLDDFQKSWWRELLIDGMGEYFYLNRIDFTAPNFVQLISPVALTAQTSKQSLVTSSRLPVGESPRILVPVGGGKDSVVTLETVRKHSQFGCLSLNPSIATWETIRLSGAKHHIVVERAIDPELLRLNKSGYLNGHTPFSAYLAFLSVVCAELFDYDAVAVSNERSSNEGNAPWHGSIVNHQYSKSFDFEQKFTDYCSRYLTPEIHYFSLLRPLYELQIARRFAGYLEYHPVFRSCNRGQRDNRWCFDCPKCLFVYVMLFPFLEEERLRRIFPDDLFMRTELETTTLELVGLAAQKPFECVGTLDETKAAFFLSWKRLVAEGRPIPPLVELVRSRIFENEPDLELRAQQILSAWNDEHAIPAEILGWLREELHDD